MRTNKPTRYEIIRAVCAVTGISREDLLCTKKDREFARARFLAYYLGVKVYGYSSPQMGDRMGRDHSTVINGAQRLQKWLDAGLEPFPAWLEDAQDLLRSGVLAKPVVRFEPPPAPEEQAPPKYKAPSASDGAVCSTEWWRVNEKRFRAGVIEAQKDGGW